MIDKGLFLSEIPTKQLLVELRSTYSSRPYWNGERYVEWKHSVSKMCKGGVLVTLYVTDDDLKEELSKREHIPGKKEAKAKRQYLAHKYRKNRSGKI